MILFIIRVTAMMWEAGIFVYEVMLFDLFFLQQRKEYTHELPFEELKFIQTLKNGTENVLLYKHNVFLVRFARHIF